METNGILLNDGSIVGIGHQTGIEDALQCKNLNYCFHFVVDLNGVKPPNRWGVDTFTLVATDKKLIPVAGLERMPIVECVIRHIAQLPPAGGTVQAAEHGF